MIHRKTLFFLLALMLVCATNTGNATVFGRGGNGIRIDVKHHDRNGMTPYAGSDWILRLNHRETMMHWQATPFVHKQQGELETDATLLMQVKKEQGLIELMPKRSIDRSRIVDGHDAAVTMYSRGAGRATVEMQVGIDDLDVAAGDYQTVVTLSITAP